MTLQEYHKSVIFWFFLIISLFHYGRANGDIDFSPVVDSSDYTFLWWSDGYPPPEDKQFYCFQSGYYGFVFDTKNIDFLHFGKLQHSLTYSQAAAADNTLVMSLDKAELGLTVKVDGAKYLCIGQSGTDKKPEYKYVPQRIIQSGKYLQHFDVNYLNFEDSKGNKLKAQGRIEVIAWPERCCIILELTPQEILKNVEIDLVLSAGGKNIVSQHTKKQLISTGKPEKLSAVVDFSKTQGEGLDISVTNPNQNGSHAEYDDFYGAYIINIPPGSLKKIPPPAEPEIFKLTLKNSTNKLKKGRLYFRTHETDKSPALVGVTPTLTDTQGCPLGIDLQISKNWHKYPNEKTLYEGSWFHAYTVVSIEPGKEYHWQYRLINGVWGSIPSVSHAQLSLAGYGGHQLWDQVAIGNWGESITYDPEVGLFRSFIDDVRPLMVWSMDTRKKTKWSWTNNVGGGNFLIYESEEGKQQPVIAVKSEYDMIGPNLTKVTYHGFTSDRAISCRMTAMTARTDDINRNWHKFRYDVLKPVTFARLAFYQMGADRYNINLFENMAAGNENGLLKEWQPERGGLNYSIKGKPIVGKNSWFSIHGAKKNKYEDRGGALANRGLIIRSWKAKLGGRNVKYPCYSVFGTEDRIKSANFEISPPISVEKLLPGDYVECELVFAVFPSSRLTITAPTRT